MAKRSVYVCDGCNAIMVDKDDGYVIRGSIQEGITDSPKVLVGSVVAGDGNAAGLVEETALCKDCLLTKLMLGTK